uniref:Uncharacterized protein n=1 Tax=Hyaloperonospora arabidopsidis (strain Emoy2) TaxID=559515 RepID=M4BCL0_HYAAE
MNRQALDVTPPRAVTPCLSSPAAYFGIRQPGYARASENVQMAQAPQQVLPQAFCTTTGLHGTTDAAALAPCTSASASWTGTGW